MIPSPESSTSPKWGPTMKLLAGLTFVAVVAAMLVQFRNILGPLLLAFILSYVLHPLANWMSKSTRLSWRASVNLIFLVMILAVIGFFTVTGVALVQQATSLFDIVRDFVENDLEQLLINLSTQRFILFGAIYVDMNQILGQYDVQSLVNQALGVIQPVLSQTGGLLSSLASSTLSSLGWGFFIFLVSYFTLADAGQVPDMLAGVEIPGYNADLRRLGRQLGRIWNAFMRGQLVLYVVTVISSFILLTTLGVRNALALALLAGGARFVPYVGPFITWTVSGVVAFFQTSNYFGLETWQYVLLVIIASVILDQVFDNIITPRLYGSTLGVHPAAVLVAAIIAANLLGIIGLLLAAPVLATLTLFSRYAVRKMLDLDPWPEPETQEEMAFPGVPTARRAIAWLKTRRNLPQKPAKK
ncbi:MAG: AI-2E family transporter [Anaerolineales bacterium]|jgi:predicted PurR-regulated permease PerM|nr:AI-2E family transporter [Anaerolineales bacterium]